jgi:glucosamine--fructose-6-phosphate aminotransferase (isomerizing)
VAAHLVEYYYKNDFAEAFRNAVKRMKGFFAFVAISRDEPDKLFAFKRSNPLVVGVGDGEYFVASDVSALLPYTRKVIYLDDDEFVELTKDSAKIMRLDKKIPVKKTVSEVRWNVEQAQKGGFPHFMLKEIYDQPKVLEDTLRSRIGKDGTINFDTLSSKATSRLKNARKFFIVSCGTAYHAGLVGRYMIEEYARAPVEVQVSSEFRYCDPILTKDDVVILITQSGETADTLAALREAKEKGAFTLAIVNVVGSTIAREAHSVIYTHAGPEIGVASTKAYSAQLITLALFAVYLGVLKKHILSKQFQDLSAYFLKLPRQVTSILKNSVEVSKAVKVLFRKQNFIYLGRSYNYPNALEGALKLKEITYAHAHGYAAGEMKHGPIALIDKNQPVVCLVPCSKTYEKMVSNIEEIHARRGIIISIATEKDETVSKLSKWVFSVPKTLEFLSPILTVVPLQLFAYKVAVLNKRDVDQPRNLAKSVTVE